jgi:hypothetical protein
MNFEPQRFFIGQMDFGSILLPGALLTYLLTNEIGPVVLGDCFAKLAGAQAWAAFLFAGYFFAHQVFMLGSCLDKFNCCVQRYSSSKLAPITVPVILATTRRALAVGRDRPRFGPALRFRSHGADQADDCQPALTRRAMARPRQRGA